MARLLSYLLILASLTLLPAAFANANQNGQASDMVKIAVDDLPVFFSPYATDPLELQYANLFFDPLFRWTDKRQIEKRLVAKWRTIKPGVTRFYLRKNIKFHSGNQLSSKDVIWTFSQIVKEPQLKRFFAGINSIKRVDKYSFDLHSALSNTQLLDYLTHFFVLDAAFYTQNKIDPNTAQEIISPQHNKLLISGTGPYQIKQYNPALHLDVVANKDYWQGQAATNELNFIKIKSANSRQFALLANDIDISASISNKTIDTVHFAKSKSLVEVTSSNVVFFTINDKRSDVFKRSVARNAIHLAINQEGMVKHIINNMGSVRATFTPVQQVELELPNPQLPTYDVPRAKYLLDKIEMPAYLTLLVLVDEVGNTPEVAKALVNMMKRVGIKLVVTEVTDVGVWNKQLFDYDFTLSVWQTSLMDSNNIYQDLFVDSELASYIGALFEQEKSLNSIEDKVNLFGEMQEQHRIIPLFFQNKIWATDNKYNLATIFSINGIPYWHLLTTN
ncbi:MAG: peptide/nickel transport system substrate-binding protein [Psychromonas sp.]|jgi:peptide/nickel transport system substrate-binding protein|uniref:ABC transporter substrate-binding protein n=1 Tax=Psychromonas sp. TaxID=1884585 RepID=UPI0039E46545